MWMEAHFLAGLTSSVEPFTRERYKALWVSPKVIAVTLHKVGSRLERWLGTSMRVYHLTDQGWQRIAKRGQLVPLDDMDQRLLGFHLRGHHGATQAGRE